MNRDDLLGMLDLGGEEPPEAIPESPTIEATNPSTTSPMSPTALHLDDWGLRRGRELLAQSGRLRRLGIDKHAAADFLACAFDVEPELMPGCTDSLRYSFVSELLRTPDYHALHSHTALNEAASEVAAVAFAEQFSQLKKEEEHEPGAEHDPEMAALKAAGRAASEAKADVDLMGEVAAACGLGEGTDGSNDPTSIAALYKRVRHDPALKRICEMAGKFRRLARSRQRMKVDHGVDEVVGVTLGGDLSRLLTSELAMMLLPETELDALRRLVEGQALCREHRSVEPVGLGPILVVVDESGSMDGPKAESAKGLALALAWVASRQKRWSGLIAFSGDSGHRLLALPPNCWDHTALCDWLCAFIGNGSECDVPVAEMPDLYRQIGAPRGRTDVVMITDCQARIPQKAAETFNTWKQEVNAQIITLAIRGGPGDLVSISDELFQVSDLTAESEAAAHALSI